ncbi:PGAP1-like protein-domain-containing protein [Phascolomyces articulosus]|uniref:GPI inositol-deacylase n=1 Tax=Phascolomyces articulosus TaxID=60185 RepID=A0AAD5K2X8_9FUNG|nr:PGAP1-like protein-domain-containing protein [Phascolomyces articulosus]
MLYSSNSQSWHLRGVIALLTLTILWFMVDSFLHQQRDDQSCTMSYSRPSYVHIVPKPNSRLSYKYELYLFRETVLDNPNEISGVPALFIPGHAGSYKQVRSIAATSSYYYKQKKLKGATIDFFTVDLNEEFSALSGQLLFDQAEYLNDAIEKILSFYDSTKTSSVLIVGHSMGGIVARLMLTLPNYRSNTIHTILTLATPHTMEPIVLGPKMERVYDQINFSSKTHNNTDITLVSLAGGTSDNIVNSDAAILPVDMGGITVFSTGIPKVWTSCDHMAILWCNQLVRVVSAALVESVQQPSNGIRKNPIQVFENHFINPPLDIPRLPFGKPHVIKARNIPIKRLDTSASDTPQLTLISIPIGDDDNAYSTNRDNAVFNLMTNDLQGRVRVFLCKDSKCTVDVTHLAKLLPSSLPTGHHPAYHGKASWFLELNHKQMQGYDNVGVWEYGNDPQTFITATMNQPSTTVIDKSIWEIATTQGGVSFQLPSQQLYSTIQFLAIHHPLLTYKLTVQWTEYSEYYDKQKNEDNDKFAPMIEQKIGDESKYHVGLIGNDVSIDVNFYGSGDSGEFLQFNFWKLPEAVHGRATLNIDWYGSLGKCVLRYGPSIVTSMFIMAMVVSVNGSLDIARSLICLIALSSISGLVLGIPTGFDFWWLPSVSLFLGTGILYVIWIIIYSLVFVLSRIVPKQLSPLMGSSVAKTLAVSASLTSMRIIPVPVIVTTIYIYWLLVATGRSPGNKLILLFMSALLPYNIPEVVVYVRDLIVVGWHTPSLSLLSIMDDIPMLFIFLILMTFGNNIISNGHFIKFILYIPIIYYTLFGYTYPYPLHMLMQKYI